MAQNELAQPPRTSPTRSGCREQSSPQPQGQHRGCHQHSPRSFLGLDGVTAMRGGGEGKRLQDPTAGWPWGTRISAGTRGEDPPRCPPPAACSLHVAFDRWDSQQVQAGCGWKHLEVLAGSRGAVQQRQERGHGAAAARGSPFPAAPEPEMWGWCGASAGSYAPAAGAAALRGKELPSPVGTDTRAAPQLCLTLFPLLLHATAARILLLGVREPARSLGAAAPPLSP